MTIMRAFNMKASFRKDAFLAILLCSLALVCSGCETVDTSDRQTDNDWIWNNIGTAISIAAPAIH